LQGGMRIIVAACAVPPGPGVDTQADLERARKRATGGFPEVAAP